MVPASRPALPSSCGLFSLSQTASMAVCVLDVFFNENLQKCFAAGGAWGMGRGETHVHAVPGFPLGPGHNKNLC